MKKNIINLIVILSFYCFCYSQTSYKIVNTCYEAELLQEANVKNISSLTYSGWYFNKEGIDKTAQKMVDQLPKNEPVVLYGISLGGTVARRMTQIASERGKNVKGYIAQSSPLSGDRLTNKAWATTSLGLLGGYATICGSISIMGLSFNSILSGKCIEKEYDCFDVLQEKPKQIVETVKSINNNKSINRDSNESLISNVTIPLLDVVLGKENNERGAFDYAKAVFLSNGNNVKDLDPKGNFMNNIMNKPSEIKKETTNSIKRAFLISTNGNIYESSVWTTAKPIYNSLKSERDGYRATAKKKWWAFAYWELRAACVDAAIVSFNELPKAWSTCVCGSRDYSKSDGFVPADDNFFGKSLKMSAPNLRSEKYDKSYNLKYTSHVDYSEENFMNLSIIDGKSYSRKKSVDDQIDKIKKAVSFMGN